MSRLLWKKMLRDLRGHKAAIIGLVLIVGVGIGMFSGLASVYRDLDRARADYYRRYRMPDFVVDAKRVPDDTLAELARDPNVALAEGRVRVEALATIANVDEPISATAHSMPVPRRPVQLDLLLVSGAWFSADDAREAILNDRFAKANGLRPGDRFRLKLLDREHNLLLIGTAMSPEYVYVLPPSGGLAPDDARYAIVYLPQRFLQEASDLEGAWNQVVGRVHDASAGRMRETLLRLSETLDPYGVALTTEAKDLPSVQFLHDELAGLRVSSTVMPVIFLSVAALVLNVMLGRIVVQQRGIVGTLKALGRGDGEIMVHYLAYGLTIGLAGGILGALWGRAIQSSTVVMYRQFYALPAIPTHVHADLILTGLALALTFAALGALKGIRTALRLEPAEAMRPPAPERVGRVFLERVPWLWTRLPFRWKMVARAVLRNPFRSSVTMAATAISMSLMVATLALIDSFLFVIDYEFARVARQDITVGLREPVGSGADAELRALPGIVGSERQLGVACELSNGQRSKRIGLTGLPQRRVLQSPRDATGRPIVVPPEGLVLSSRLAEILAVRVGDVVRLRPLIGERRETVAQVVQIVDTYWGLSGFASIDYLASLIGEENVANTLLAKSEQPGDYQRLFDELRERPAVIGIGERSRAIELINKTLGETLYVSLVLLLGFAGVIAFGAVVNAALVSLSERDREVGTLRVLGATRSDVTALFGREMLILGGIGLAVGVAGGVGLSHLLALAYNTDLYRFPAVILPIRFVQAALVMLLFLGAAHAVVAFVIHRMDWLSVLKIRE
jgi:putative ABC transport system permease protein